MRVLSECAGLTAMIALLTTTGLVAATSNAQAARMSHHADAYGDLPPADAWAPSNVQLYAPGGPERYFELAIEDAS
jgi:hypothetical protein